MDTIKLDFEQAKAKHLLFKSRLRALLFGIETPDEGPIVSQYECAVGKWIYGHALKDYGHIPEMQDLEKVHAEIHGSAKKLVSLYKEGKVDDARLGLKEMEKIADKLVGLLNLVEGKIEHVDSSSSDSNIDIDISEFNDLLRLNHELDIRLREHAANLNRIQQRFEMIAKATQDAVWDWDLVKNDVWWNESFKEMFGYAKVESGPESWYNRIHPDDRDRVVNGIHAVIDHGGQKWHDEYRFLKADGSYATVYDRGYAIHNEEGKPIRMVGSMTDLTKRLEAEKELAYQSMLTKTITDNATMALFMMNADGYCTFMNPAGEKMFGYTFEEIRQKPLHYMIHHHRPDGSEYPLEECPLDRALPQNFDVRAHEDLFFRKDGTSFPVLCAAAPIFENGVPVSTVIEVRDITEEKESQEKIKQAYEDLEVKVTFRNLELERVNKENLAKIEELEKKIELLIGKNI
ncbi:MAG TPA: PAS domain S-box protein [Patescibacteria group bacterium]|nr:PAS domain S-box protein [Patescibacteria group bacterium]